MNNLIKYELRQIIESVRSYVELENYTGGAVVIKKDDSQDQSKGALLKEVRTEVFACSACPLHKTKTNFVFGAGSPDAELMFIGEAPGYDEDQRGEPFVGRAGQLLTKIIEAMGYKRSDVYIANVLKCRPPDNRSPLPSEVLSCHGYLGRQVQIIRPKAICLLGKFAASAILKTDSTISQIRGKFYDYNGIKTMPTFHPAYLLRNPDDKKIVWQDMKKIMAYLKE